MKKHIIAYGVPILISTILGFMLWKITGDKLSSFLCALLINATILLIEHGSYIRKSQNILQFFSNPFFEKPYIESLLDNLVEIKKIGDPFMLAIAEEDATQCSHRLSNLRNSLWATENIREFLHFYSKLSEKKLCKKSHVGLSVCPEYRNFGKRLSESKYSQRI